MYLLSSPVRMGKLNASCNKGCVASTLPDNMGEGGDACQAKRPHWMFCLLSPCQASLSSFWVRVGGRTSRGVLGFWFLACLAVDWNISENGMRFLPSPSLGPHGSQGTRRKALGLAQTFKDPWSLASTLRMSHRFYSYLYIRVINIYWSLEGVCMRVKHLDSGARMHRIKSYLYQSPTLWP